MRQHIWVVHVKPNRLVVSVAFHDQQIGVRAQVWGVRRPFTVAGIGHDLAADLDPDRGRIGRRRVARGKRRDGYAADAVFLQLLHFNDRKIEFGRHGLHAREQGDADFRQTLFRLPGTGDRQGFGSFGAQHRVQQKIWNAAAMIAMKV